MQNPFSAPVPPGLRGATRIVHRADLACTPHTLFDFVTNASQWHRWHPATHAVRNVPDRPLVKGEQMVEHIKAAHRSFEATWTVIDCDPGRLWRITTATPLGASVLTYRMAPAPGGCHFERTCDFRSEGAWALLDGNLTRWMLARQAAQALRNLQQLSL
ncbi:MAG: SRPBCC family protein [Burkholderiales bacterium]|nr:SRPBCC family protein [Burkholderiales bacterium]